MTNLLLFGFMPSGSEWIIILLILIFILPFFLIARSNKRKK